MAEGSHPWRSGGPSEKRGLVGRPAPRGVATLREAAALVKQGWLLARAGRRRPGRWHEGERLVLFVHGFLASGPVFDPMRQRIERELGLPTLDFSYGSWMTFEAICLRLQLFVEERVHPATAVSIVSHSMGGLVARSFIQESHRGRQVDRLVTLATPHGGTANARFATGSLRATLHPESALLERLGRVVRNAGGVVPHVAIVAGKDRMVRPPGSAAEVDEAEVHWIEGIGHNAILYDIRTHRIVLEVLRAKSARSSTS